MARRVGRRPSERTSAFVKGIGNPPCLRLHGYAAGTVALARGAERLDRSTVKRCRQRRSRGDVGIAEPMGLYS